MTLEQYKQIKGFYLRSLDLIIHGQPKPDEISLECWHEAAQEIYMDFKDFFEMNPIQPDSFKCN